MAWARDWQHSKALVYWESRLKGKIGRKKGELLALFISFHRSGLTLRTYRKSQNIFLSLSLPSF